MNKKIETAIEQLSLLCAAGELDANDALKYTQSVLNLANALASIKATELASKHVGG